MAKHFEIPEKPILINGLLSELWDYYADDNLSRKESAERIVELVEKHLTENNPCS